MAGEKVLRRVSAKYNYSIFIHFRIDCLNKSFDIGS
jgi:hypothetical protein